MACVCCGEKLSHKFLALDHITSKKKMGQTGTKGGDVLYSRLVREGFPKGYQTLCHNCNAAKGETGICPHQLLK